MIDGDTAVDAMIDDKTALDAMIQARVDYLIGKCMPSQKE